MGQIIRSVIGVALGLVTTFVVFMVLHFVGHAIWPMEGVDMNDMKAVYAATGNMPAGALIFLLATYALGVFLGAFVAALIAGRTHLIHAFIVGGVFLLGGILELSMANFPSWFWVADVLVYPVAAFLGGTLAALRQRPKK